MFLQVRSESFARSGWADVKWIRNNTNNNNSTITTPLTNNMNTKIKTSSKCTMTLQTPQTRNAMRCVHFGHRNGTTLLNCYDFIQLLQSIRGINLFTVLFYGCQSSFFRFTLKCVRSLFLDRMLFHMVRVRVRV